MRNHRDKVRDMTRSVLPSTERRGARKAKAAVHRSARRVARLALADLEDDADDPVLDGREARREVRAVVERRRWDDKVGPFLRWARAHTKHLATGRERVDRLKGLVGRRTLIIDHAIFHFAIVERRDEVLYRRHEPAPRPWQDEDELALALRRAVASDHAGLNRLLRTLDLEPCRADADCVRGGRHVTAICRGRNLVRSHADVRRLAQKVWRHRGNDAAFEAFLGS